MLTDNVISEKEGQQFFSSEKDIYSIYLKITNQKQKTAEAIASAISNLFKIKKLIKLLCVGGGSGEADLAVISLLPKHLFEVENIDPSLDMCRIFEKRIKSNTNATLIKNQCTKFENSDALSKKFNLIFCINSVYFLEN